jgi:hypothetical protein
MSHRYPRSRYLGAMGLFGSKDDAAPMTPIPPPHPALASLEALQGASLHDLGVAVLVAGVALGPGSDGLNRITAGDVYDRVKAAVCAAQGVPNKPGNDFDHGSGDIVLEGLQILEQSLLLRLQPMGSAMIVYLNRRGTAAIASSEPDHYVVTPSD